MSTQDRLEINWINSAGGALGAVSSAVVLSTFGAAGTLVGAAVGSLCITVGGSVYAHSMRKTKNRVAAVASNAGQRTTRAPESETATAPPGATAPPDATAPPRDPVAARQTRENDGLPWKRIAAMAGALFAIALAVIVAFELFSGRAVSTYTGGTSDTDGGTTFSRVIDSPGGGDDTQDGGGDENGDGENGDGEQGPAEDEQQDEEPAPEPQPDEEPAPEPQPDEAPAPEPQQEEAPAEG